MLLFRRYPESDLGQDSLVAVFGIGLLGGAISEMLRRFGYVSEFVPLTWTDRELQWRQLNELQAHLFLLIEQTPFSRLEIVWSAGRAGFGTDKSAAGEELENFLRVLALAESMPRLPSGRKNGFHLLSSVGGLFVGLRHIDSSSQPEGSTPYGQLKLAQEAALLEGRSELRRKIYRLTSVFGVAPSGARQGLVSRLIVNANNQQVTPIFGRLTTLRDFVWSEDIARFLVGELHNDFHRPVIATLASGKPTSITEVIRMVESAVGKRVYLRCQTSQFNDADITASPEILPKNWFPSDLRTTILRINLT